MLSRPFNSSISAGSITSSAYAKVDITSRPFSARIAAVYCLLRITKRAIATLPLLLHRPRQQHVRLGGGAGRHVVGGVEVDRIDLVEVDELLELDGLGGGGDERLELVGVDDMYRSLETS